MALLIGKFSILVFEQHIIFDEVKVCEAHFSFLPVHRKRAYHIKEKSIQAAISSHILLEYLLHNDVL